MTGISSALRAAHLDLRDFERRVVLMEPDRHRAREIAELFESQGWYAEALASYRLAGEEETATVLASRFGEAPKRRSAPAPIAVQLPAEGPYTLFEELTMALQARGEEGVAESFASRFARSLAGDGLPPETVVQSGAKLEALHGPLANLRVEIAAALLCLGEDAGAYQVLVREAGRPAATLRTKKLLAGVLEARGRRSEALALYEDIAASRIDYPGVQAALTRLARVGTAERRYAEQICLHEVDGVSAVRRAFDAHLGREVVIKRGSGSCFRARMERELEVCERAAHPALVTILDVDPHDHLVVYESLEGSLASDERARAFARDAFRWSTVAYALAAMHEAGLVHGRITHEHVLFSNTRGLVLGGLAGASDELVRAPEDVAALATCLRRHVVEPNEAQHQVLEACTAVDPASRPAAKALARALRDG